MVVRTVETELEVFDAVFATFTPALGTISRSSGSD
jgi:hypothetical protein